MGLNNGRKQKLRELDRRLARLALAPFQHNASDVPPLFHYASCRVLRIILETQKMAATLHRDLEPQELRVAHPVLEHKLAEIEAAAHPRRTELLAVFRRMYMANPVADYVPIYLTCFSAARDSPELWSKIPGAEVCIGFKLFPEETTPRDYEGVLLDRVFLRVNYDKEALEQRIHTGLHDVLTEYDRFTARERLLGRGVLGMKEAALNLMLVAAYAGISSKDHDQFRHENEWRWVATPGGPGDVDLKGVQVHDGKRFITLRMRESPKPLALAEIVVRDATVLTEVEKILDDTGYVGSERPRIVVSGS